MINKLGELVESEDAKAVEKAKQLQAEFKKIGHVPLKFKNKIWKDYREVQIKSITISEHLALILEWSGN